MQAILLGYTKTKEKAEANNRRTQLARQYPAAKRLECNCDCDDN